MGVSDKEISEEETDIERDGELELKPSGEAVPLQVTQGWLVPAGWVQEEVPGGVNQDLPDGVSQELPDGVNQDLPDGSS